MAVLAVILIVDVLTLDAKVEVAMLVAEGTTLGRTEVAPLSKFGSRRYHT